MGKNFTQVVIMITNTQPKLAALILSKSNLMNKYFKLLICALLLVSCSDDDDNTSETYFYTADSQIILNDIQGTGVTQVTTGDNLVFKYRYAEEADPDIADSGYAETIIFEIDPSLESFSYSDEELSTINAYFDRFCFCAFEGSIPIVDGIIEGAKVSNRKWTVSIDVSFETYSQTVTKSISGSFVLE